MGADVRVPGEGFRANVVVIAGLEECRVLGAFRMDIDDYCGAREPYGQRLLSEGEVMAWRLDGTYFESCSCDAVCPCTWSALTAKATLDRCRALSGLLFCPVIGTFSLLKAWGLAPCAEAQMRAGFQRRAKTNQPMRVRKSSEEELHRVGRPKVGLRRDPGTVPMRSSRRRPNWLCRSRRSDYPADWDEP